MLYALGTIVRIRREELKLQLWSVAAAAQIAPDTLLRIERGQVDIDLLTFRAIADKLLVTPTQLLELADQFARISPASEQRIRSRIKTMGTMDKLARQHGRLLNQLDGIERHNQLHGRTSDKDTQRLVDIREHLMRATEKMNLAREQQDQRERFLYRYLRNKSTAKEKQNLCELINQ